MKKKIKLKPIKVKSTVINTEKKKKDNDGGYTWVG